MKTAKYAAILAVSLALFFGMAAWGLAMPDEEVSRSERRKLAQRPECSVQAVVSGAYMEDLEAYLLDQFPLRDGWRTVKALTRFTLFRQLDNNGIYLVGDHVLKLEDPLREAQVTYAADKINSVIGTYLQGMNVRYAVVPDKNFFAAAANGYPHMDYDRLTALMQERVNAPYVDLFPLLRLDDYYRTDPHWRQEALLPVAQALADAMGLGADLEPEGGFEAHTLEPFYGAYCGQSALPVEPDVLTYLTSAATDAASMTGIEFQGTQPVYTVDRFAGMDGYDVFAGGAQAIVTLESPGAKTGRELILFRDSFGSSLAPLFLEGYSKVTLIDLRYVASSLLEQFVDFEDQDVLFLYSTSLLNSGMLLK